MTVRQKIENLFASGVFSTTAKLMMVLYYWILSGITDADATALSLECGYTFTKPTTTGAVILTNGATTYTIVTLITAYHNKDFSNSYVDGDDITDMIDDAKSAGYITADEQTTLKGLGW